jgi:HPt (histidine-containing phosphotransfer) domain-containing protein
MSSVDADFDSPGLRALLLRYREVLPTRRAEVEKLLAQLLVDDCAAIVGLKSVAHKLAGSAASYGFENISLAAARLDDWMIVGPNSETSIEAYRAQLAGLARALVTAIQEAEQS